MRLDSRSVAALELPTGKSDVIHFDHDLKGFGYRLRAAAGGRVIGSWLVQYRRGGATRRLLLGQGNVLTAEQARAAAKKALARIALGEDPQGDRSERRSKDKLTRLDAVIEEYLQAKQPQVRAKTFSETRRYLTGKYFKPLHGMALDSVTRKDIAARLVIINRESGNVAAACARANINSFFIWAMRMGLIEQNPVVNTIKPKEAEDGTHVLTGLELGAVWRACGDDDYGRVVRLLILTACRRQEVGGMRWSELDTDAGTWTLPSNRSKNHRAHTLPLPAAAWQIIGEVPRRATRDHLFGVSADEGFSNWRQSKEVLDRRLGDRVRPFHLHDIRRSVATGMADIGVQPHVIEQILNHQSGHKSGPAGIYNKSSYERETRAALATWADHLRALIDGGERKIHLLPQAASAK